MSQEETPRRTPRDDVEARTPHHPEPLPAWRRWVIPGVVLAWLLVWLVGFSGLVDPDLVQVQPLVDSVADAIRESDEHPLLAVFVVASFWTVLWAATGDR